MKNNFLFSHFVKNRFIGLLSAIFYESEHDNTAFPSVPMRFISIRSKLLQAKHQLSKQQFKNNIGSLCGPSHPAAVHAYRMFISQNPNHLGNWSLKPPMFGTLQLEYEVIQKIIDLYHADKNDVQGYITSGGTEGNIFAVWSGRTYLEHRVANKDEVCLVITELSHYSIRKAGNVCNVPQFITPLHKTHWNMDPVGLSNTILTLYSKGYRGFMIPLTYGYTLTGTSDEAQKITRILHEIQRLRKDVFFFLWVDAALNGLILPFISAFKPLKDPLIQCVLVDFHKFGQVPYPAGVLLHKKSLRNYIEQPIEYLEEKDNTLLGSRSGLPAVGIWEVMHSLGAAGFRNTIHRLLENKQFFIDQVKQLQLDIQIVTNRHSLSCGVIFHSLPHGRLPVEIEKKYWLYPAHVRLSFYQETQKSFTIYKMFFLPHVSRGVLRNFVRDVGTLIKQKMRT